MDARGSSRLETRRPNRKLVIFCFMLVVSLQRNAYHKRKEQKRHILSEDGRLEEKTPE